MAKRRQTTAQKGKVDNGLIAIIGVGILVLLLVVGLVMYNQSTSQADITVPEITYPVGVTEDGQPFKGAADAPVEIIEFADFRCSHCAAFYREFKELEEDYIHAGKVKLIFKNYPLLGQASVNVAQAVECALDQGPEAFWMFHDVLLDNQNLGDTFFSRSSLKKVAQDIGLDSGNFNRCFDANRQYVQVETDLAEGRVSGVSGTPTLFINGEQFTGRFDDAGSLQDAIDQALDE